MEEQLVKRVRWSMSALGVLGLLVCAGLAQADCGCEAAAGSVHGS
jgi:hypothetical protein